MCLNTRRRRALIFYHTRRRTRKSISALYSRKRILGIVSRGGAILAGWIRRNKKENPFYEYFDEILDIAREYDVTLSLGDGLRPGSILDATDPGQLAELKILGQLALRAQKAGVQAMIEGPGHVPLGQIRRMFILKEVLSWSAFLRARASCNRYCRRI